MSSEPDSKRVRVIGPKKLIGTHDGTFHCDEALAVFLLKQTSLYRDAEVIRTRDLSKLQECTVVVDVGAVYDEPSQRFDHHQKGFEEVFGHGFKTKLSSAGLIYKHFGQEIIKNRLQPPVDNDRVAILYLKLYEDFIEGIDGIDNGVLQYPAGVAPQYRVRTDLSSRVGWLNPAWNEVADRATYDNRFTKASEMAGGEFLSRLDYFSNAWLPARDVVLRGVTSRHEVIPGGRVLLFEKSVPWKEHLFHIENELGLTEKDHPYFVLYPDEAGGNWRVQAVPTNPDTFVNRKSLPESWRGLRDDALTKETGIPECIFVHISGFIGGNRTKSGALEMVRQAVQK